MMTGRNDSIMLTKDRALGLALGNLNDAAVNLSVTQHFLGRAKLLRKIKELQELVNMHSECDQKN